MFKSYFRILGSIPFSAMLPSIGVVSAVDVASVDSKDSQLVGDFVQELDQARYRHEERRHRQVEGASSQEFRARAGRQVKSTEQERRKAQTRSQQRLQLPGAGQRGMAMDGGPRGGRR